MRMIIGIINKTIKSSVRLMMKFVMSPQKKIDASSDFEKIIK